MSGNDNATETDPKLIRGPRSFSAPEWNEKAGKVIQRETKGGKAERKATEKHQTQLLTFPSDICARLQRQRT